MSQDWLTRAKDILMPIYPLQDVMMDRGEGCYMFDSDQNKYLDFAAGIAVCALGHGHPEYIAAAKDQLDKVIMCQGTYVTQPRLDCAELLLKHSCCDQIYFSNSGAEAMEAAFKLARKWAYETKGPECNEVIAFYKGFHGRTMGAASLTYKRDTQPFFGPYVPGISFAHFNDIESVKKLVSTKTAAIIVEPIQGEGGILPMTSEFAQQLRALCDEHDIALIFDEIQVGIGRLGTLFAYERFGVEPDIIALAKGLGGGFPIGAMIAKRKFSQHLTAGSHGTTYGGNPFGTRLAHVTLQIITAPGFLEQVRKTGEHLRNGLEKIKRESNAIKDIRGMGLMMGVDTVFDPAKLLKNLLKNGLMATRAGDTTLRLTPPLILTTDQVDECLEILDRTLKAE